MTVVNASLLCKITDMATGSQYYISQLAK